MWPALRVAGGVAVEEVEACCLHVLGDARAEERSDPKSVLERDHGVATTLRKCELFAHHALNAPSESAFARWLDDVRTALGSL